MGKIFTVGERILLTFWVGGMWAIGYLAVPSLFHALDDRQLAGALAGNMFTAIYVVGLVATMALVAGAFFSSGTRALRAWRTWVLIGAVVLIAVAFFVIQPMMQELKAAGLGPGSPESSQFGRLHGVSSVMYLLTSLLGLALVIFGLRGDGQKTS